MVSLEKAMIDMYADPFVKEIVSIIKQPENQKILWNAYNELPHNIDFFRRGSYAVIPHSSLPLFLEEVNKELSEMLGMDSCLRFRENLCIIQNDSECRSYFHPLTYIEDYELCPVIGICAEDMNEYALYPTVAHELAHFFQDCRNPDANMDWNNFKFLKEGFARGVELIIAKSEAKTRGKSALVNTTLERLYEDITEFASNGYKEDAEKQLHYEGHWGSCAFIIAEAKHGRGIYREMMHSPQPYEMLIDMLGGRQ